MSALPNEIERYQKKNRFTYVEDIECARTGGYPSLIRLIKWDKGWLLIDWVQTRILRAQWRHDRCFLQEIGEAVGTEPRFEKALEAEDKEDRRLIIALIQMLFSQHLSQNPSVRKEDALNEVIKAFFDGLEKEMEVWPAEKFDKSFYSDLGYFRQYIKRHIKM